MALGLVKLDSLGEDLFLLNARAIFCLLLFFVGITFHTKKLTAHSLFPNAISNRSLTQIPP